jgi:hypothetical protein
MDEETKALQGSPSRDRFKQRHKELDPLLYASDVDFVLVIKDPKPGIVAALDYKTYSDVIRFSEVIAYNAFKDAGIPVYIIQGSADPDGCFTILKYISGNHNPDPPVYELQEVCKTKNWQEFEKWEFELRGCYRKSIHCSRGLL